MRILRRLRRASCSSGLIWLREGASFSALPRLPRLGKGLRSGMTSPSPASSSTKSPASLLAFLAGRPGLRPEGALAARLVALGAAAPWSAAAAVLRAALAVVVLAVAVLAAVVLAAVVLAVVVLAAFTTASSSALAALVCL